MIIDCADCVMRDIACDDCVVTALLGAPAELELEADTRYALRILSDGGLVPPLRMQRPVVRPFPPAPDLSAAGG